MLAAKLARAGESHVRPLNALAETIESDLGLPVPRFDPASGGVDARVLMLLETPSRAGTYGSGLISIDNDDTAAANLWRAHQATGLPRDLSLVWNAVPWYVGHPDRIRPATTTEVRRAAPYLREVLTLLPRLEALIAFGRAAQRAVIAVEPELTSRGVVILAAPHPSQRVYNRPGAGARELVHTAFATAAQTIEE